MGLFVFVLYFCNLPCSELVHYVIRNDISNVIIKSIASDICYVGGDIHFEKSNWTVQVSMRHHRDGAKAMTKEYFKRLYDHSQTPILPKPWMDTPSVVNVRSCVVKDPFEWPRKASLQDLQALLCKGNNHPSPGPDQWEK